jgi:hypothetical protein
MTPMATAGYGAHTYTQVVCVRAFVVKGQRFSVLCLIVWPYCKNNRMIDDG